MPGIEVAGLGAIGSSALALIAATTSVHPFGQVIRLIDRDQLFTDETPLLEERQVRVFVSGCRQHVLRFLEDPAARLSPTSRDTVERAVAAVGDLRRWLDLSQSDVAELCGFSLRASRYWESGETSAPRPSSVRRLFEVHAFIASLVTRFGEEGAVGWLRSPSNEGIELREKILARDGGVQLLLRELAPALFATAPRPELAPTEAQIAGELAIDDEAEPDERTMRVPRREPPKRPRKAPRRS